MRLLVEAVRDEGARAAHLLCGNYRRSKTVMNPKLLLSLIDGAGLDTEDALFKIHIVSAFSERHLIKAPSLVEGLLEGERGSAGRREARRLIEELSGAVGREG